MARLFSLKPLVFALSVGFSTAAAAQEAASFVPDVADYVPVETAAFADEAKAEAKKAAEVAERPSANTAESAAESTAENLPAGGEEALSLGETCLFCSDETVAAQAHALAREQAGEDIMRSGEDPLPPDYTRVTADYIQGQNQDDGQGGTIAKVRAEGDVVIERNQEILNADWAEYDQASDTVTAGDQYKLYQNGSVVSGKELTYNLTDRTGISENVRMATEREGRRLQSVSEKAEMKGPGLYHLVNTKFNTCSPGDASWYIKAKSVEADEASGIGVAKNAALVFGGVPVLYTPWADFPLNGSRKSGFLVPNISTGSDGFELSLPYYLNLKPNLDATVTPGVISRRGVRLGGQVRYLEPAYSGKLEGNWMPHDKKSDRNNRSQVLWQHNHTFSDHLSGGVDFNHVSDNDYYRDFYSQGDIADNVNLNRQAWLNYNRSIWGGQFGSSLMAQKYQTLANENGYKDEPYAILPRLSASWSKNTGNAQINLFGQFTRFDHDSKQSGNRLIVSPSVKWDFHNEWGYIRPKASLHYARYDLDSFNGEAGRHASLTLPMFSVDSGMTFERNAEFFGKSFIQTLEPRLFYNYIPTKSQSNLPNFDTSENSFKYAQLFRDNIYSGYDRVNSANSLSTAVQSRLLNPKNGAELFRAGIGQKFYFTNDNVMLDGRVGEYTRNRSDWVAFAHGNLTDSVRLHTDAHYNQNEERFESYAAGIIYNPEPGKVLSARYKYGRNEQQYLQSNGSYYYDKLKQIDVAAQWPLAKNLYGVARFNYELQAKRPLDMLVGAEYKSNCGCWSASIVAQRYVTGEHSRKNAVLFNLQLKDLSNIGQNPFETLRLAIPGYRKTNEIVKP
ncbi:LPS-assembly protein LptD [Neisseria animalis]|uniref:LPS-assembly protein LptD n=1 Tax=Neisseria animalis TaxID=492 RepID=A0A5P3MRJ7_NEIAN|nr:LPS-assembly protein LptD [Neisseria animalis]QEY23705.1 LPS-assembly protein LptD [Neisseria animalis]ROW32848.1 LPS-assembly protein LptD [Neisseria animalis]VEE09526.1 OstA protein [Neisseria animalis]